MSTAEITAYLAGAALADEVARGQVAQSDLGVITWPHPGTVEEWARNSLGEHVFVYWARRGYQEAGQ